MRRIIAALIGVVLAIVGALVVITYANNADERAAAGLETESVLVALEEIPAGTPVEELGDRVEVRQIARSAVVEGAVTDLATVESLVLSTATVSGEQLSRARLVTEQELRARGAAELPAQLANHHQVTLLLDKARALGGDIAPGDTVGLFASFDIDAQEQQDEGQAEPQANTEDGRPIVAGGGQISVTDLTLHKVPVVRVEGAFVAPAVTADQDTQDQGAAEDRIFVTLALEPVDAARVVFAIEWGTIYLSLEPEGAPEDVVPSIVITLPERGQDVLQ